MGKPLIQQRRGKGKSQTYLVPDHKSAGELKLRNYDELELTGCVRGKVIDIIKDSVHYAPLALIEYETGEKCLVPAVEGMYVGQEVCSGMLAPPEVGNVLPLKQIPEGTKICMLEIRPGDGGKLVRASGTSAVLIQKTDEYAIVQLPSKKKKIIHIMARAMIGVVAGGGRDEKPFVKAGNKHHWARARNRYYPITSACKKNAVDHPFGGKFHRNKGKITPLPKKGYPIKYGYYGSRKTGRGAKAATIGTKKDKKKK